MDELLLRRAQRGDADAFEQLMTPLENLIWRVCWHYTGHRNGIRLRAGSDAQNMAFAGRLPGRLRV